MAEAPRGVRFHDPDASPTIRVLYVDSPEVAGSVAEALESERKALSVVVEHDAERAIRRLSEEPIDCVVSDYRMTGMDGLEFLEAVRADHPDLPFVLFTGAGSESVASEAISAGVSDYVPKGTEHGGHALLANRIENLVEQYRATRAAERTHRRFRKMIEHSTDVTMVADADGTFEYVSPSSERVLGYSPEELVGTNGFEYVHPEDREEAERSYRRLAEGDERTVAEEFRFRTPDDEWMWVEVKGRDLREDPDVGGLLVHCRDVTDRRERSARLESLLDHSSDVVTVLDETGTILYESPSVQRLLGHDPDELVGEDATEYTHPDDRPAVEQWFESVVEGRDPDSVEYRFRAADGSWRWFQSRADPDRNADLGGYVVNSREITDRKACERQLEQYRQVVEAAGDAMYALDEEGRYEMVNDAFLELSGLSRGDVIGDPVSEYMTEEDFRRGREAIVEILENEDRDRARFEFSGGNYPNSDRTFETILSVVTDDDGQLRGSVGVIRDVTEHREREEQLRRQNERLETIVENVPIVLAALDGEGRFTLSTGKGLRSAGIEPGEAVGESIFERYEGVPEVVEPARKAIEGETAHATPEVGGRVFDAWFEPVLDDDGEVERVVVVAFDITERVERERELEQYETIVETVPEATFVLDRDARLAFVNRAVVDGIGVPREDLVGEPLSVFDSLFELGSEDVATYRERIEAVLEGRRDQFREELEIHVGEQTVVLDLRVVPVEMDGEVVAAVGIGRDVSDRKEYERRLERQNERLDQFASLVSHDLRNPLEVANAGVELVRAECDTDHVEDIERGLDRMETIIEDLLTLAREGDAVEDPDPVALAELVETCWEGFDDCGVLEVETDLVVRADRSKLRNLLENLLRNAVEHAGPDATVRVGATDGGFFVADDGSGVPHEDRDAVFEPGHSGDDGSGFGLYIVREIAGAHGWSVSLTDAEGGGARFEVTGVDTQ